MEVFDLAPVKFEEDEMLVLDQTKLPAEEVYIKMKTKEDVWDDSYAEGARRAGNRRGGGLRTLCFNAGFRGNAREGVSGICAGDERISEYRKTDGGQSFVGTETLRGHAGQIYFGV